MIVLELTQSDSFSVINLAHVHGIDYDETRGELQLATGEMARLIYIDKGTPAKEVWDKIRMALTPLYEPRSLQTHGVQLKLDLSKFQTVKENF